MPSEHVRDCETEEQSCPEGADWEEYEVMELPCATVVPSRVHEAAADTEQEAYAYEPESVPSVQARVCDEQVLPYGTVDARYAVADEPWVTVVPSRVQEAYTVREAAWVPVPPAPVAVQP